MSLTVEHFDRVQTEGQPVVSDRAVNFGHNLMVLFDLPGKLADKLRGLIPERLLKITRSLGNFATVLSGTKVDPELHVNSVFIHPNNK